MHFLLSFAVFVTAATAHIITRNTTCDPSALDNSTYLYPITVEGTTVGDVAEATGQGLCDIGRANLMADVEITPNVGQELLTPAQVCEPDNTSCLVDGTNATSTCISGGPRLYYTLNGGTYTKIAARLNITVEALVGDSGKAYEVLTVGQFLKVSLCNPSQCILQPHHFTYGVYKDLAEEYGTTVGEIIMLSPTYNYSTYSVEKGKTEPTIDLPINCTTLSSNVTVLS